MIFIPDNHEDINRYYRQTYVKFREFGDKLFYIKEVYPKVVLGKDEDGMEFELHMSNDHPYEVDYVIPDKSVFQYKNHSCILERIPAKQYHRGLTGNNTSISRIDRNGDTQAIPIDFNVLKAFVGKQEFPLFDKAVTVIGRKISVALSKRFSFIPHKKLIMADRIPVAED